MGGVFSKKSKKKSKKSKKRADRERQRYSSSSSSSSSSDSPAPKRHVTTLTFQPRNVTQNMVINLKDFEKGVLDSHNQLRKRHNAKPLQLRSDLSAHAQKWAQELANRNQMQHSTGSGFGENLAYTSKPEPTPDEITRMWYDEIHDYNFQQAVFTQGTGHFTQLVWKNSTHMGVGIARGKSATLVCVNYFPPGNYQGQFKENVDYGLGPLPKNADTAKSMLRRVGERDTKKPDKDKSSEEVSVKTNVEEYTDKSGKKVRKTTKITTTVTTKGNSKSTKTKTETHTEFIGDSPSDARLIGEKIRNIKVGDDYDRKIKPNQAGQGFVKMTRKEVEEFESDCITRHNELRRRHGVPSLTKNRDLQRKAQKWAEHLVKIRKLQHSSGNDCGENIAYKHASDLRRFKGAEMVDMWYDEIKDYDYARPAFKQTTGHFTQVVWKETTEVGVGVAYDGNGTCFCVANYLPHGNVQGRFQQNVPPKLF